MHCCYWMCAFVCALLPTASTVATAVYSNLWAVHIPGGERVARSVAKSTGFTFVEEIMEDHYHFVHNKVEKRSTDASLGHHMKLTAHSQVLWGAQQEIKKRRKRDLLEFNDEKFRQQWYLQSPTRRNKINMNVMGAWKKGYTGKGVVVTILDDGIEKMHPDLSKNYDAEASYDINNRDPDPTPRYDFTNENRHGTRCAGEVAAAGNNSVCGVGVAYEASIGGIKMLDGDVTDSVEAMSLSRKRNHIDIYSASWGPDDDGKTVDGPALLARRAFREGVTRGRDGKGSVFVWASGNGGSYYDNCNCDGYTNSIYTLSVSSATEKGNVPWYSEACSSTLVSTFSSGDHDERQITTTDLRGGCTSLHTGTSASAPLAAGIVALTLQANMGLTWRDVQYISVLGASSEGLNADDWITNGAGHRVSHHFGFGMMNAEEMVNLAANWTNIPEQHVCEVASPDKNTHIMPKETVILKLTTAGCRGSDHSVRYVEHVQAKISLSSSWRGDLQIWLISPSGTRSTLLTSRAHDDSRMGFNEWAFLTTHNWGEESSGEWQLHITNGYRAGKRARLSSWSLVLYGTSTHPLSPPTTLPPTTTPTTSQQPDTFVPEVETRPATAATEAPKPDIQDPVINVIPEVQTTEKTFDWPEDTTINNKIDIPRLNEPRCPPDMYYMRDKCIPECPSGYYSAMRSHHTMQCLACHSACAECSGAHDSACTECYFGYELVNGRCETQELRAGLSKTEPKSGGMSHAAVRSIVYGGVSTVCMLLIVLAVLMAYYKYQQRSTRQRHTVTTIYKPANPAEILASSQHSSQQELMETDSESSSQGRTSLSSVECRYAPLAQYPQMV